MKAKIADKKEVAKDVLQFDFVVEDKDFAFTAGQYLSITLPEMYYNDSRGNIRYFSLCSSPSLLPNFSIVTRWSTSAFKRSLSRLGLGREVILGSISGNLILPPDPSAHVVMIAGGMGISPFMSIIRRQQEQTKEQAWLQKITLLYINHNEESTPYLPELRSYAKKIKNFHLHLAMTNQIDWTGDKRTIDHEMIKEEVVDYKQAYYLVAGPPGLVMHVANNFDKLGLKPEQYRLEEFIGY